MADFGLTEDMYGTNYYRRMKGKTGDDEKVPIRWMPPESIENDIYNEKTDVVRKQILWHCEYHHVYNLTSQSQLYWSCGNSTGI